MVAEGPETKTGTTWSSWQSTFGKTKDLVLEEKTTELYDFRKIAPGIIFGPERWNTGPWVTA